jgi:hypothetical protein
MTGGAIAFRVNSTDLEKLFVDLKAMEGNLQVELRRGIREASEPMARAVRANASWSSRIPDAVQVKPSFVAKGASVRIVVDASKAPEGRVLDHGGNAGTFKHPVWGHRDRWATQSAQPFFEPSFQNTSEAEAAMQRVMDRLAAKAGFH